MSDYRDIIGPAEQTPEQARAIAAVEFHARIEKLAAANVEDAERNLTLARLAHERAQENRREAYRLAYASA